MDGGSYKFDQHEPTFNIEECMSELEADDQCDSSAVNTGMVADRVSFLSANANEHRNNEKSEAKFWPNRESKSDLCSGMCQTPTPTASNSVNFSGLTGMGMFPTTSPMAKSEISLPQYSQQTAPELNLRHTVQESVFQLSPNQSNLYYQSQQESFSELQTSQQYMPTLMQQTNESRKVLDPSTSSLGPEASGANSLIGSSTRQLDISENCQKFVVQNNCDLLQQPRIIQDSDVSIEHEYMISQKNFQQIRLPMQFYPHLDAQHQQKIQGNYHSQGLVIGGPLNLNQFTQRMAHEGSLASIKNLAQNRLLFSNFADWHHQAYSQLLTMKRLYLTEVMRLYQRYHDLSSIQPPNAEYAIRIEKIRIFVEKIITFLNMPRSGLVHYSKEKVFNYMNQITHFIYQNRAKLSVPSQYHHPISQPQRLLQNQNLQFNMPNGGSASAATGPNWCVTEPGLANSSASSSYISQQRSSPEIPALANNISQGWFKQRVPDLVQPCSTGLRHHNASSSALMNFSKNEILGSCGSATRTDPLDFLVFQSQNPRNYEDRQFMQANNMQQPHQPLIDQHKMSENDDLRLGETMCSNPTMFQPPFQATSQHINNFRQTVSSSSSCQSHVAPLQSGQCSSQVDSNEFSSKVSKGAITLQSVGSPLVVPSPLTPLTPSSSIVDHVKKSSKAPVSLSQNETQALDNNCGALDMLEVENSHLKPQVESEGVQAPIAENGPLKHLLDVVKSSSQKALNSALQDIGASMNLIDRRAGSLLVNESRSIISNDLADEIQYSWQDNDLLGLAYEVLPRTFESFTHLSGENFDYESMGSSQSKRLKTEANDFLMKEIIEVNKHLLETVVEIAMDETCLYEADQETIIRCSYIPVGQFATSHVGFPRLLLTLLVNRDYPHSSPSVLDVSPYNSSETEEVQAITQNAKSNFSLALRNFSEPMSVSVMVKAWDVSAREVYHECAKKFGGECFSSRYGGWKSCVTAV